MTPSRIQTRAAVQKAWIAQHLAPPAGPDIDLIPGMVEVEPTDKTVDLWTAKLRNLGITDAMIDSMRLRATGVLKVEAPAPTLMETIQADPKMIEAVQIEARRHLASIPHTRCRRLHALTLLKVLGWGMVVWAGYLAWHSIVRG
mgnify:CR=1 FL=1